jgi:hypothetical protein
LLLWSILLLLFTGNEAFAQTKISGKIINERTFGPASGATITLKKSNRSVVADKAGKFTIEATASR